MKKIIKSLAGRAAVRLQQSVGYENTEVLQRYLNYDEAIDEYKAYVKTVFQSGKRCDDFVEFMEHDITFTDEDVKPIAFYLPQFYTFPENDKWWGKGFTDWTNVTKAVPQYSGHYQPHLPLETFYDLADVDVMKKQVALAQNYGIYGFCFHYYWFNGKRLLEKPLDNFLNTKEGLDFPFCISWANENWSRRWDGLEGEILIAQEHSDEDDLACIAEMCKYIRDERYIKVNGKPLISMYKAGDLPDADRTIRIWRKYCREIGIGEIWVAPILSYSVENRKFNEFDGVIEFPPHNLWDHITDITDKVKTVSDTQDLHVYDMEEFVAEKRYFDIRGKGAYKGVFPGWDNTARRGESAYIYQMTPQQYETWLRDTVMHTKANREQGDRFVFINAWNEWAEGAHLEPDRKYGYAYLQATADSMLFSKDQKGVDNVNPSIRSKKLIREIDDCKSIDNNKNDISQSKTPKDDPYPLVSVIIPCYNDGEYLLEALDSALSQTYPSVEIIIVDDASYDPATISILKSISHPRIEIYHNTENLHLSATRNKGISLSNGKYILPLDADDKIDESYIQKAIDIMENEHSIGVVYCKANLFGLQNGPWDLPEYSIDEMLTKNIVFATALFQKEDWKKVGGYSEAFKAGLEDYDFWLSILELEKEIYQIPEVLFFYRKKELSMTTDLIDNLSAMRESFRQVYLNHPKFFEKHKDKYLAILRENVLDIPFQIKDMQDAIKAANENISQLKHEKEQIEQSTFWRITKPARSVVDMLRRLFYKRKY